MKYSSIEDLFEINKKSWLKLSFASSNQIRYVVFCATPFGNICFILKLVSNRLSYDAVDEQVYIINKRCCFIVFTISCGLRQMRDNLRINEGWLKGKRRRRRRFRNDKLCRLRIFYILNQALCTKTFTTFY